MNPLTLLTSVSLELDSTAAGLSAGIAAIRLLESAGPDQVPALIELGSGRRRPPTLLGSAAARELGGRIHALDPEAGVSVRGRLCTVAIEAGRQAGLRARRIVEEANRFGPVAVVTPPDEYRQVAERLAPVLDRTLLIPPLEPSDGDLALIELVESEAASGGSEVEVLVDQPGRLASRRALAGSSSTASPRPRSSRPGASGRPEDVDAPAVEGWRRRLRSRLAGERGQATPLVLGAVFALVAGAVVLVAIAGAITGKGRAQSAADLSALSAARSMKDDLPRLLAPPTLPSGLPNPAHMPKSVYLGRARLTAVRIATSNGASPLTVSVRFPDALSYAPVSARVSIRTATEGGGAADPVWAEARVGASISMGAVPAVASGGGYAGPLAERLGHGMRPDVATAFDRMSAAAAAAGFTLVINSAFRSDAEQAALFAANPDPTWVARPGTSLHRCGTELDLGPPSSYSWLAANTGRFGFLKRYAWEPWHFGYTAGPEPCSQAGNRVTGAGDRSQALPTSVPGFVPAQFRRLILGAAMKSGVSAALLSAQLLAESNFDPSAVSSAGAQGIAQFMPGTAAAYGLRDPFDPAQAIDAQAQLMKDLLNQFGGKPALALAAYNAGPGAVSPCDCIPDFPETQAYVARILALLGGTGAIAPLPMEIELVR